MSRGATELSWGFIELLNRGLRGTVVDDEYFAADHGALWSAIVAGGWLDLAVPEADGGAGLSLPDMLAFAEAWGRRLVPLPLTPTWVLRGEPALSKAAEPGDMLVAAVSGGLIPLPRIGHARCATHDASLADVPLDLHLDEFAPSLLLGQSELPSSSESRVAQMETLWAAEAVGAAAGAFQVAFDYAGERVAFGQAIAEFQAVKHRVADMYERLELARTAALWAANTAPDDHHRGVRLAVSLAREVVEGAIQVMGGIGFTWEAGVHFYLRHILAVGRLTRQAESATASARWTA